MKACRAPRGACEQKCVYAGAKFIVKNVAPREGRVSRYLSEEYHVAVYVGRAPRGACE